MTQRISLTYYSDILCVWAHIAQARVDEIKHQFPDTVSINYRFCSVFGDTAHKIGSGWAERGGYQGFGKHVLNAGAEFPHVQISPEIWKNVRPASSTPSHLVIKAVQRVDYESSIEVLQQLRRAFFERCLDIGHWTVLQTLLENTGVSSRDVKEAIDSGLAYADLEADHRDQQKLMVQGSPTFILNEGRQKLYGNVGYSVIEANIKEMLRAPTSGEASWC